MNFDEEMQAALQTFLIESNELLQEMEDSLLNLEHESDQSGAINNIFRAAHTIKGSSGLFGLDNIVAFTHVVESVLDSLREGKIQVSTSLINLLLPCCDHIAALLAGIGSPLSLNDPQRTQLENQLLSQLHAFLDNDATQNTQTEQTRATNQGIVEHQTPSASQRFGGGIVETGNWHISLRFGTESLRNGMDPLSFIRYLSTLGEIVALTTIFDTLPSAALMDPEACYLGFEINLNSTAGKEAIEGVFEFVREDSIIHILPPFSRIDDYIAMIETLPEDNEMLGEILIKSGVLTRRELDEGLEKQQNQREDHPQKLGEILVEQHTIQPPIMDAALEKQKQIKDNKARENQSIRVDAERLDKLIDLVGELIISCAAANLRAQMTSDVALQEANAEVISLVEEVRDSALQLRMVPIGSTFNRFQRVVRDVSAELGKDINLIISGGETEVDKSVVEKIGDPLMHLVRNAMDHGIERAEIRTERGKPAQGTLRLNAYHSSGNIVIEVSDDGGGLNRDKILAKAIERELIQPTAVLSDPEIYALIFEPGFSTADQISNLSGRGVGMDVVKRNITELRGTIHVDSVANQGTTLKIHLPLTLAIIDGFLVGVGESSYVIPLERVVECVELPANNDNHDYMELRGEVLPFIRLRQLFQKNASVSRRQNVIVVEHFGSKAGLVVDRLMGELQTVIKPLGKLFGHVQGVGGSTILGSGEVALIIDVPALLSLQE